jgi:hypothetical protein
LFTDKCWDLRGKSNFVKSFKVYSIKIKTFLRFLKPES